MGFLGFLYSIITALFLGLLNNEKNFRWFFAIPLGFGFCSILYFLFLCTGVNNILVYKIFEAVIVLIAGFVFFSSKKLRNLKITFPKKISLPLACANLLGLMIFFKFYINSPLGNWDGLRMWNTKAEFMFRDISLWKNMFLQPHFLSHNDYPLFLPSFTARMWHYAGFEDSVFNITVGLIFTFGGIYLLYFAVKYFKNETLALLSALILMLSPEFLVKGAAQCADVPLAYFILCTIISLFLYFENKSPWRLILATVFAAYCGWIKNEGLMFFLIFMAVMSVYFLFKKCFKEIGVMYLASLPLVGIIGLFKAVCATPNDLVKGFFAFKTYSHIFQIHNYIFIIKTFLKMFVQRFSIFFVGIVLLFRGICIEERIKTPLVLSIIIMLFMCLGYFVTYLLSPHDLDWILKYSLDRIIIQVIPAMLFLYVMCLKIGKEDTEN